MHDNKTISFTRLAVFAVLAATTVVFSGCCKKKPSDACPTRFRQLKGVSMGKDVSCTCTPGSARGTVWGSDIYTTDSSICAAAVHAGVISSSGGKVKMRKAAGCGAYESKKRNGVRSHSWGNYGSSFYFVGSGKPAPSCYKGIKKLPATTTDSAGSCPRSFKSAVLHSDKTLRCNCTPRRIRGPVWGSVTYTTDSSPCRAAVHAGVIPPTGGRIVAKQSPGCSRYKGTSANGIKTSSWGRYSTSFFFPSKSNGQCQ